MKNRRKDKKPTDDPEDVTSWDLPSQVEADEPAASSFFTPPPSSTLADPPDLNAELPSLPPPPPPPGLPPVTTETPMNPESPVSPGAPVSPPLFVDAASPGSWSEAAPSAEIRDFPQSAKTTTPFRPDLPESASVIDLTARTEHPYDDIYAIGADTSSAALPPNTAPPNTVPPNTVPEATDDIVDVSDRVGQTAGVRELPSDLRSALQIATTPSLGLPVIEDEPPVVIAEPDLFVSSLAPPPTAQAAALSGIPSILTVDVLGSATVDFSGLFTDVLTDNGFTVDSVSETSILLTREAGTVTIDLAEAAEGCIVEVAGLPATAVKKLMLSGLLQIGYELQASRTNETVLRDQQKSMVRVVQV